MMSRAIRRIAVTLTGSSALLALVWLIRQPLGIQQYSVVMLLAGFGLYFLGRILRTETSSGAGRALGSILWNLVAAFVAIIVSIWILGWVASLQSDVFPGVISSRVPDLAVGAIATGLGAFAAQRLGLARKWGAKPFIVPEGRGPTMEGTRLAVKQDTLGMPIRRGGRTIGCVLLGEVSSSFKTPMGMVSASLPGPVTTVGVPFQGRALSRDEVVNMSGKSPNQLDEEAISRAQDVDVGRIRIRDGCMGDRWKIGPLIFDWDGDGEHHPRERCICYDLYFPELTRLEALGGAELIVCISASPGLRRRFFEGFCLSRAMENAVYLAYVNRVGIEDGNQFWGGSRVVAPNGSVLVQCKYDVEDFQPCKLDLAEVSRSRAFIPTIKDLDPQLFDQLRAKSREA